MSPTVRWMIAFILIILGIVFAAFSLGILGFATWGCSGSDSDTAAAMLYVTAAMSIIAGIIPAVLLIRNTAGKFVALAAVLGLVFILGSNGVYLFYTLNIC